MNIARLISTLWYHCAVSGRPMFRPSVHATRPPFGTATDTTQPLFRPATKCSRPPPCPAASSLQPPCRPVINLAQPTYQPTSPSARTPGRLARGPVRPSFRPTRRPARPRVRPATSPARAMVARPQVTSRSGKYTCSGTPDQPIRRKWSAPAIQGVRPGNGLSGGW